VESSPLARELFTRFDTGHRSWKTGLSAVTLEPLRPRAGGAAGRGA